MFAHEGAVASLSYAVNTSGALDNGPLYVVPGSHRLGHIPHWDSPSHLAVSGDEWSFDNALRIDGVTNPRGLNAHAAQLSPARDPACTPPAELFATPTHLLLPPRHTCSVLATPSSSTYTRCTARHRTDPRTQGQRLSIGTLRRATTSCTLLRMPRCARAQRRRTRPPVTLASCPIRSVAQWFEASENGRPADQHGSATQG